MLIVQGSTPREAVYWHWWADCIEDLAPHLDAMPEIIVRAAENSGGHLGDGSMGRLLRQWLPRFTVQEVTHKDLREDVESLGPDEVVAHAAMGEVCVVVDMVRGDYASIDAVIAHPTVSKLRGYLGMEAVDA